MSKWSLQRKMTMLLVLFAVIPLCVMDGLLFAVSWRACVTEALKRNESALDNIEADALMLKSQTESVIRAFADSEALRALLSSSSDAEWTVTFNTDTLPELTKAELYLSSLNANIMVIFDGNDFSMERWYMLLNAARFADDEGYRAFVESGRIAEWYGVDNTLPDSLADVYDFRALGERFIYYCRAASGYGSSGAVIKCAIDNRPLIESALLRAENSGLYLLARDRLFYAADDRYDAEALSALTPGGCLWRNGALWQRRSIPQMNLDIVARLDTGALVADYMRGNGALLAVILLVIFWLFFLSRCALGDILVRLKRMTQAADSINARNGRVHLPEDGEDEVGHVVRAFNSLFDRLDRQMEETMGKEKAKRHMQALALQYQLNPHFLFNSLLWLQMELEEQGVDPRITENITKLGSVLRYNLSESLEATLSQEATQLRAYIDFMCDMKQQHIALTMDWDHALDEVPIPRFMLQPLVENALQHGLIRGVDMHIDVSVQRQGDRLRFRIANDGKAIEPERLQVIRERFRCPDTSRSSGLGISNLVQRLALKYADRYDIQAASDDALTVFIIDIPADIPQGKEAAKP